QRKRNNAPIWRLLHKIFHRRASLLLGLDTTYARRWIHTIAKDSHPTPKLLCAMLLFLWENTAYQSQLLTFLIHPEQKQWAAFSRKDRILVTRMLMSWKRNQWRGKILDRDVPKIAPLLDDHNPIVRQHVALTLAHMILRNPKHKVYKTNALLEQLRTLANASNPQHTPLAALYLHRLHAPGGHQALRNMSNVYKYFSPHYLHRASRKNRYLSNRISRILLRAFTDFSGYSALFESTMGTNRLNLKLPAFRILFARNLLQVGEWADAMAQFLLCMYMPEHLVSPVHRSFAAWGIAKIYAQRKRYTQAQRYLQKAQQLLPTLRDELLPLRGYILWKQGQLQAAQRAFRAFLNKQTTSSQATNVRGWLMQLHLQQKQFRQAKAVFAPIFKQKQNPELRIPKEQFSYAQAIWRAKAPASFQNHALEVLRLAIQKQPQDAYLVLECQIMKNLKANPSEIQSKMRTVLENLSLFHPSYKKWLTQYQHWFPQTQESNTSVR
ncbi:MAG: tetratricopeptide repeat protein, partial [Myxococcota bacterium]